MRIRFETIVGRRLWSCYALATAVVMGGAKAQVDGRWQSNYGAALSVQTVRTDTNNNAVSNDNVNELNAAYAYNDGTNLFLLLTGNLEADASALEVFIDSEPGGQNQIQGSLSANNDNWATRFNMFRFDVGFEPDHYLTFRHGDSMDGGTAIEADFVNIGGGGTFLGSFPYAAPANIGPLFADNGIQMGFDNRNEEGISGGVFAANGAAAAAVVSGMEFAIPLPLIGDTTGEIKLSVFLNNSSHIYLSNQFLGGLEEGTGRLGSNGTGLFFGGQAASLFAVDLNDFPGEQFFTVPGFQRPPSITAIVINNQVGSVTVTWDSVPGESYAVEASTDLVTWDEIIDSRLASGLSTSYVDGDPQLDSPKLFYRVRVE